jgi:hypothetical protein
VGKGVGFLRGFLVLAGILVFGVDLQAVDKAIASGARLERLWLILAVEVLTLILVLWSITDAARTAKRTPK